VSSIKSGGGAAAGQTFTLTTNTTPDVISGTSGNDTITGGVGTWASTDVIVDASSTDSDVYNLTVNSYSSIQGVVTNVETINVTSAFASVGYDAANTTLTKTLNLVSSIPSSTATVAGVTATKVASVNAGSNVGILNVNSGAAITDGTSGTVTVNAGDATTVAVGHTGNTGSDTYSITTKAGTTLTLSGGTAGTDTFTLNLGGGTTTVNVANGVAGTGDINVLNIASGGSSSNTLVLSSTTHELTSAGSSDRVTITGDQNITIRGDGDVFSGTSATNGSLFVKSGKGLVTLESNAGLGAASFFNRAAVDNLRLSTAATGQDITINENTNLVMAFANGTQSYDVGNTSTAGTVAAGAGTLKVSLEGTSATNAIQASMTTGAGVGTLVITNNTIDSTITTLNTTATATTVDTVVASGSKALTVGTWTATAGEVFTANGMTGVLTATIGANGATLIGGSADDVLTGGGASDNIRGGAGADTINGGAFADTLTGGTGSDQFLLRDAATIDTITDYSASGANGADVLALRIVTTGTLGAATIATGAGNAYIAAGTTASVKQVSAATTLAAGQNVFAITGTFANAAALQTAIEAGGTRQLTFANATTAGDDILVAWSDGTDAYYGWVNIASAATTITATNATFTGIATLTGITDVSTLTAGNFLFLA